MEASSVIKIAKYRLLAYRLLLRVFMGKKRRDHFVKTKRISYTDFLPLFYGNRIVQSHEGFKALPRLNTDDFYLLFQNREMELREHFKIQPGETFVDVGSNVGFYSLLLANLHPDITIISIEAHPDTFEALNKNIIVNNFKNITSINKAISSHNRGKLRLYEYWTAKGQKNTGRYNLSNRHDAKSFKETDCDSLDNLLNPMYNSAYVIKIDIEGEEVNALLGAKNTLKKTRKIIVEIHSDENLYQVKQILLSYHFSIEIINIGMIFVIGTKEFST
jgi:FkbM family methyltransferase